MSDYNQFVMAVNKIFEITAKIKAGWKDQDNLNIADSIEDAKTTVIEAPATTPAPTPPPAADLTLDDEEEVGGIEE